MRNSTKKSPLSIAKVLKIIGKPTFFLFTILVVGLSAYLHLLKLFVQQVKHAIQTVMTKTSKLRSQPHKLKGREGHTQWLPKLSIVIPTVCCTVLAFSFYWYILRDLPAITELEDSPPALTTKIYDRHDTLLYQIYKDENRTLVSLEDLPHHLIQATLAAEDKNFYHHFGIDLFGITRAAINNLRCSIFAVPCPTQGGSTITQQLIKNTLLSPEKTLTRKLKELVLSLQAERYYTKDQILEMYFNQIGYGGTSYGIEQASFEYFGKSARDLTLSESAMLSGLPIAPTTLSPYGTNPYLSKIRQQQVLESMVAQGSISENDKLESLSTALVFRPQGINIRAPHFVMYIKDLLVKQYGESVVARGGLSVKTSLDLSYQEILQQEINDELSRLGPLNVQNGAGVILDPGTGEILAMVGSRDFFDSSHDGQVNVTLAPRQPGSAIKPITYALALSRGLTPNSTIDDSPICFVIKGQPDYCPRNYDGRFHGQVTLRTALASSYNIPAIKLLNTYGLDNMIGLAKNLGINTWEDSSRYGLSLTLGGGEITMLDLASVYSVFANQGTRVPLAPILSVDATSGSDLVRGVSPKSTPVLSPAVAYQISSILSDPHARAPAFGMNSILSLPGANVAVKTGTTNDLRDNWTIGYTPDLLVAVWVGNNDNSPMSQVASGITGASPIWARTMVKLLDGQPSTAFLPPENLIRAIISCSPIPKYEYFVPGTEPKMGCDQPRGDIGLSGVSTSQ